MKNRNLVTILAIVAVVAVASVYLYSTMGSQAVPGTIEIDGSSTVFPITQAVAEEFSTEYPEIRVNVAVSVDMERLYGIYPY